MELITEGLMLSVFGIFILLIDTTFKINVWYGSITQLVSVTIYALKGD